MYPRLYPMLLFIRKNPHLLTNLPFLLYFHPSVPHQISSSLICVTVQSWKLSHFLVLTHIPYNNKTCTTTVLNFPMISSFILLSWELFQSMSVFLFLFEFVILCSQNDHLCLSTSSPSNWMPSPSSRPSSSLLKQFPRVLSAFLPFHKWIRSHVLPFPSVISHSSFFSLGFLCKNGNKLKIVHCLHQFILAQAKGYNFHSGISLYTPFTK